MGKVFTWKEVSELHVPLLASFLGVATDIRCALADAKSIRAALLFGSVVRGDHDIRSDIDCVVIYDAAEQSSVMSLLHALDRHASRVYVPINFTLCDTRVARTRFHNLGVSFVHHLDAALRAGGLIKGDPSSLLDQSVPARLEIESYLRVKLYTLQEAYATIASADPTRRRSRRRHIARKMLICTGTLRGDAKRNVRERYRATMPEALALAFDVILEIDRNYSTVLERQLTKPDATAYRTTLVELETAVPFVIDFIRDNVLYLCSHDP